MFCNTVLSCGILSRLFYIMKFDFLKWTKLKIGIDMQNVTNLMFNTNKENTKLILNNKILIFKTLKYFPELFPINILDCINKSEMLYEGAVKLI